MAWFRDLPAPRRIVVAGVTAVVVMAFGAVLAGGRGGGTSTLPAATEVASGVAATAEDADPPVGHGPSEVTGGVGVGVTRDEAGAVAAAVSYATAPQSWLYLADEDVQAGVEEIVVPEARDELTGEIVQEVGLLRTELAKASGTVWFVVSPLATRVDDYDDESGGAVVRVWSVRVLSAEGVAVPQSGWQTTTFRLRWHADDWKIAETHDVDGPVPQLEVGLQPWTAHYLGAELDGFVRLGATP
jgi:hypothetical protein